MKKGWKMKKLGEVALTFGRGKSKHRPRNDEKLYGGDYPFIQTGDVRNANKFISQYSQTYNEVGLAQSKLWPKGTICITIAANIAETGILEFDSCFPDSMIGFVVDPKKANVDFAYYCLQFLKAELQLLGKGSAQANINMETFETQKFPFPSVQEQQRIVTILDEIFSIIDQAKQNLQCNLQNAKEIFQSKLQIVFDGRDDEWQENILEEVLLKTESIDPTKHPNKEFIYLDVSSVNKETKEIEETLVVTGKNAPSRARKLVRTNDIIFATIRPTHNRVAIIPEEYNEQVCSTGYFVLRPKSVIESKFVFYFLLTNGFNKQMEKMQRGASYPAVSDGDVKSVIIPYPNSLKVQQKIVRQLDTLLAETKKLESLYQQKLNSLEELKKGILQKAFSGELIKEEVIKSQQAVLRKIDGISTTDLHAGIIAIAFERHEKAGQSHTFHHVKSEKIIHLVENFIGIDLNRNPIKDAAGPNDFQLVKNKIESRAQKASFFYVVKDGDIHNYRKGTYFNNIVEKVSLKLEGQLQQINDLIDLIVPLNTQQAEIVATVFAAWNNLIIQDKQITDEAIVNEARENWHKAKLKIEREKFFKTIVWMKKKNIVPKGMGKLVLSK